MGDSLCFVRQNETHEASQKIVSQFVDALESLSEKHEMSIPAYFLDAIQQLELDSQDHDIPKSKRMKLARLMMALKSYVKMDVFGFNSGKYI